MNLIVERSQAIIPNNTSNAISFYTSGQLFIEEYYTLSIIDMVEVVSRRGRVQELAQIGDIEPGLVFIPFHYGYWDKSDRPRAANELTISEWDPVSKQPHFKYAAVYIRKV